MVDLNDIFNDIVLAENNSFDRGFEEGISKSRADGFAEGFALGLGKGLQVGTTIGYYRQFAELILRSLDCIIERSTSEGSKRPFPSVGAKRVDILENFPPARREKLEQSVKILLQLIDDFAPHDCESEALFTQLEKIESKYKQIKALLNLKLAKTTKEPSKDLTF